MSTIRGLIAKLEAKSFCLTRYTEVFDLSQDARETVCNIVKLVELRISDLNRSISMWSVDRKGQIPAAFADWRRGSLTSCVGRLPRQVKFANAPTAWRGDDGVILKLRRGLLSSGAECSVTLTLSAQPMQREPDP